MSKKFCNFRVKYQESSIICLRSFATSGSSIKSQVLDLKTLPIFSPLKLNIKARSHDTFLRIPFLLVPKNGSCEHIKNDLPSTGSVILKKPMGIEHTLSSSDTLLER